MDFGWIKQLVLLLTIYLASITVILFLINLIVISIRDANNGNILTDGRNKRKYVEKKYNVGNMILPLQI